MLKKLAWIVGIIVLLVGLAWVNRINIMLHLPSIIMDLKDPISENIDINWQQGPATAETDPANRPPNVVVILVDDMGINDISYYAEDKTTATFETPNIDQLANDGAAFTNGYAGTATCAVSRATIMTGRYSTRFGFEFTPTPNAMPKLLPTIANTSERLRNSSVKVEVLHENLESMPPFESQGLPPEEITMAELLKTKGYHNVHIGKWHLGRVDEMRPEAQGFDESLFLNSWLFLPEDSPNSVNSYQDFDPIDQFLWATSRYAASFNTPESKSELFEPRGYLTDYYTEEAVKVIEANKNRPFFLYLAHWGIHTPLQATKADYDALSHIKDHRKRVYAAMIRSLDRSVEKVTQALKDNGLEDNTIVIFTSDNGGAGYVGLPDINKPYRGWKITLFEGGIKVPYFVKWPKNIKPNTVNTSPVSHMDILATAAAATGIPVPTDRKMDSVNLLPFINGETEGNPHEYIVWRDGQYQAIRTDDWKLQVSGALKKDWLFHLAEDPTEQNNLADQNPEKVAELKALLAAHNAEQMPPAWNAPIRAPVAVDKTLKEFPTKGDEYILWDN